MTETIIWLVLWFFVGQALSGLIFFVIAAFVGEYLEHEILGAVLGWLASAAWEVFVLVQIVLHIVTIVSLVAHGG